MATISKGDKAPEGEVTITPGSGEQFVLSDGGSYETDDQRLIESLAGAQGSGLVKVEYPAASDDSRASAEDERERKNAARKRAREIERAAEKGEAVPGHELTPVEGARDDQEAGN